MIFAIRYYYDRQARCQCDGCGKLLLDHERSILHNNVRINISSIMRNVLDVDLNESHLPGDLIFVCNTCETCGKSSPFIPLSDEAYNMSFTKYLELLAYDRTLVSKQEGCGHSIFGEHVHYFICNHVIVQFRAESIQLLEISMPTLHVYFNSKLKVGESSPMGPSSFFLLSSFFPLPSSFFLLPSSFFLLPSTFVLLPSSFYLSYLFNFLRSLYLFLRSIYLPFYLPFYLLSIYLVMYGSIYLFIYLSIYLSIHLSIYLSIYPSIHVSLFIPPYMDMALFVARSMKIARTRANQLHFSSLQSNLILFLPCNLT